MSPFEFSKFISPAGLVWQADIFEGHIQFNFRRDKIERQQCSRSSEDGFAKYVARSPEVSQEPLVVETISLKSDDVAIDGE